MVDESLLQRIKKIYNLSGGGNDNENESASAAAKVQEMLLRYNISEDDLTDVEISRVEQYVNQIFTDHMRGTNVQQWKVFLAFAVSRANLCRVVSKHGGAVLDWIGKPSNIEVGKYLFDTLCADLEHMAKEKWTTIEYLRKLQEDNPEVSLFNKKSDLAFVHGKTWKNSFFLGAVQTIEARLQSSMNLLKGESNIMALVVLTDKELDAYKKKLYPKTHSYGGSRVALSGSGFNTGRAAGRDIQFKRGVGAGGNMGPRLLGKGN